MHVTPLTEGHLHLHHAPHRQISQGTKQARPKATPSHRTSFQTLSSPPSNRATSGHRLLHIRRNPNGAHLATAPSHPPVSHFDNNLQSAFP